MVSLQGAASHRWTLRIEITFCLLLPPFPTPYLPWITPATENLPGFPHPPTRPTQFNTGSGSLLTCIVRQRSWHLSGFPMSARNKINSLRTWLSQKAWVEVIILNIRVGWPPECDQATGSDRIVYSTWRSTSQPRKQQQIFKNTSNFSSNDMMAAAEKKQVLLKQGIFVYRKKWFALSFFDEPCWLSLCIYASKVS